MTATITRPETSAQDVVAMNVNLMVTARHIQKKKLAEVIGLSPQIVSKKLRSEITWSLNETVAAANFLGVDVNTLLKSNLTTDELLGLGKIKPGGLSTTGLSIERGEED